MLEPRQAPSFLLHRLTGWLEVLTEPLLLSSEIKELLIVPGAGHNDIFSVGMQSYMEALQSFAD